MQIIRFTPIRPGGVWVTARTVPKSGKQVCRSWDGVPAKKNFRVGNQNSSPGFSFAGSPRNADLKDRKEFVKRPPSPRPAPPGEGGFLAAFLARLGHGFK